MSGFRVVVSCPQTAAGSSLYIGRLTPSSSQSPGRLIRVSGSDSQLFLPYTTSSTIIMIVTTGLKPSPGLKPILARRLQACAGLRVMTIMT